MRFWHLFKKTSIRSTEGAGLKYYYFNCLLDSKYIRSYFITSVLGKLCDVNFLWTKGYTDEKRM
jgi:hypothetical protein